MLCRRHDQDRSSRSPLALLATSAAADTLVTNVNGIQVGADGKLQHFTGLLIGDDGKVQQCPAPARRRPSIRARPSTAAAGRCCPA